MHNLITSVNWTPIFEWCMVWWGSKKEYQEEMCLTDIGLCAENMITILSSIVNIKWGEGRLYDL